MVGQYYETLKNAKRDFNIEIVHTYTKGSSSKLSLDTVSLFAAPSLSGGGEKKLVSKYRKYVYTCWN